MGIEDAGLRGEAFEMLSKHAEMWSRKLGCIAATQHRIRLKPGSAASHQMPYRQGPEMRAVTQTHVEEQLRAGVIEPATSEWASPVVFAPKKDGKLRFCVDYRRLNLATVADTYPLPRLHDFIDSLGNASVFYTLDANRGYWQKSVAEADKDKTCFTTHSGTYRYKRMPFGLRNASATFQRALDIVLSGVRWHSCLVYLDDVIVFP